MGMTSRERWLAAMRFEPVDRLPFWPKIGGGYARAQQAPFNEMSGDEMHEWVGSDKHMGLPGGIREIRSNTGVSGTEDNGVKRTVYETPYGNLDTIARFDPGSSSWHPMTFPIKKVDDIKVMQAWYEDADYELNADEIEQAKIRKTEIGGDAITTTGIGESPLMHLVEWLAGVEEAHYLLIDHQAEVEALFEVMHRNLMKIARLKCERHPADLIYMIENTSTTLISPDQYRQYCFGHISDYGRLAQANDRFMVLHMCGLLRQLLDQLSALPVAAFEAFTAPPLGDTTLAVGRAGCPDKCLIGGTSACNWIRPAAEIIASLESYLGEVPHHRGIVLTSAGVMPPSCPPETIKAVSNWLREYELRF